MSYHEKKHIVLIVSNLLVYGIYTWVMFTKYGSCAPAENSLKFWGAFFLVLIPITIVTKIVIYILFHVVYRAAAGEDGPCFEDERDRLIGLRSMRNSYVVFCFGFLAAMAALVLGMPMHVMFLAFIAGSFTADFATEISSLYYYRKGI